MWLKFFVGYRNAHMFEESVIDALATYRLTRLVQRDTLPPVRRAREHVMESDEVPESVKELLDCPWCLSFWVGLLVVWLRRAAPRAWRPVALALAASAVTGLISTQED